MSSEYPDLSVKELLSRDKYVIPRYQRNYAWTEEHIKQLIDDVLDNCNKEEQSNKAYYLGTLVVFPRQSPDIGLRYEVIDGQQRLTTLTLLASYLTYNERANENGKGHWFSKINTDFASRKRSSETLRATHNGQFHDNSKKVPATENFAEEIVDAYEIIQRLTPQRCREKKVDEQWFKKYFLDSVRICRITVPEDTDLNHYFEVMNNRGEQLEKHEVLKARLLSKLPPGPDQYAFNKIWEACSSMERYIQYGFPKEIRKQLFGGGWDQLLPPDQNELYALLKTQNHESGKGNDGISLDQLVETSTRDNSAAQQKYKKDAEEPERFSSIINFQNFLPHVLSIFLNDGHVALDDKQLLDSFEKLEQQGPERIRKFGYALLKCRFLFDQYIIKRDATEDEREWSLKILHQTAQGNPSYRQSFSVEDEGDDLQREITLLQSMFHVSVPSRPYKYWLLGVLKYLYTQDEVMALRFRDYLKEQARAFVYNRFLASAPLEYNEILFTNSGRPQRSNWTKEKTRYGNIENILVFNFIDYLLWKRKRNDTDRKVRDFVYTFRSSVEHYYPQNPIDGNSLSDVQVLHSIGNLCLISHSKNSMLRHHLPKAKAEYYLKQPYIDSILQYEMLSKADYWSENPVASIKQQKEKLLSILKEEAP